MAAKRKTRVSEDAPARFLDEYLPFWLSQASYWISSEFHREVASNGFTFAEWRVLASLYGSEGETVGMLSRIALMKQPTLSKLVQRLETDGLVARRAIRNDRRQTLVTLTAKGRTRITALIAKARAHQEVVLRPFGEENSKELIHTLKELVREHERSGLFDPRP